MRTAIISDIHSNLEALTEVLKDIDGQNIDRIVCLGDVVGYGPNPKECIDLLQEYAKKYDLKIIKGNHDHAVQENSWLDMNTKAAKAALWTNDQLTGTNYIDFLEEMSGPYTEGDVIFAHASPEHGGELERYLFQMEKRIGEVFTRREVGIPGAFYTMKDRSLAVAFGGHTHIPGVIAASIEGGRITVVDRKDQDQISGTYTLEDPYTYIVNVGSVGQPRDSDPRACYAIFDDNNPNERTVEFRRIDYDKDTTKAKIETISLLDDSLGQRLMVGR